MRTHMGAIAIGKVKLRVEFNSLGIVTDRSACNSPLHQTGKTSSEIGVGVSRVELERDSEVGNRTLEISFHCNRPLARSK